MRYLTYIFAIGGAAVTVFLSVANRHSVQVFGTPNFTEYGAATPPSWEAPLFVVALAAGALGFVLGAAREYVREARYRRSAVVKGREVGKLQREVEALKGAANRDEDDEIIALTSR
jgi:uncharacterized integral membrane protein